MHIIPDIAMLDYPLNPTQEKYVFFSDAPPCVATARYRIRGHSEPLLGELGAAWGPIGAQGPGLRGGPSTPPVLYNSSTIGPGPVGHASSIIPALAFETNAYIAPRGSLTIPVQSKSHTPRRICAWWLQMVRSCES
jgi:hypothetical protein